MRFEGNFLGRGGMVIGTSKYRDQVFVVRGGVPMRVWMPSISHWGEAGCTSKTRRTWHRAPPRAVAVTVASLATGDLCGSGWPLHRGQASLLQGGCGGSRQFTKPQKQQSPHLAGFVVFGLLEPGEAKAVAPA